MPTAASSLPTSVNELRQRLEGERYLCDPALATVLFLALRLGKPILLEGDAGVGKTEVAKALAAVLDRRLIRLQCYEGLDVAAALYEWDFARQMLEVRLAEARGQGGAVTAGAGRGGERAAVRFSDGSGEGRDVRFSDGSGEGGAVRFSDGSGEGGAVRSSDDTGGRGVRSSDGASGPGVRSSDDTGGRGVRSSDGASGPGVRSSDDTGGRGVRSSDGSGEGGAIRSSDDTGERAAGAVPAAAPLDLYGDRFLLRRPLLEALMPDPRGAPILLIDELDRTDEPFEAFLLEILSDFQVTIPERGTIRAPSPPIVVLTSNRTREIHDAIKRRCLYHWIGYPDAARELAILAARAPEVPEALARQIVAFVQKLRTSDLFKIPGIAETLDWGHALVSLGCIELDPATVEATLGVLLKYQDDLAKISGPTAQGLVAAAKAG